MVLSQLKVQYNHCRVYQMAKCRYGYVYEFLLHSWPYKLTNSPIQTIPHPL